MSLLSVCSAHLARLQLLIVRSAPLPLCPPAPLSVPLSGCLAVWLSICRHMTFGPYLRTPKGVPQLVTFTLEVLDGESNEVIEVRPADTSMA